MIFVVRGVILGMRMSLVAIGVLAVAISLAGCGGTSTKTSHSSNRSWDCFGVWNDASNKAGQSTVAGRFSIANVSEWHAEAGSETVTLGGPASEGCGYLFHTSAAYLSISGEWNGESIRWGAPPTIHGMWSAQQQAAVRNNATVDANGLLSRRQWLVLLDGEGSVRGCPLDRAREARRPPRARTERGRGGGLADESPHQRGRTGHTCEGNAD
jgi:hypothetical protein